MEELIKSHNIKNYIEQNEKEILFFSFYSTEEIFEKFKNKIYKEFNIDILDFTIINYPHYHITRYSHTDENNYEEIHEAIAYRLMNDYWEVYYQGGEFEDIEPKEGGLENSGIYIFNITISEDEDLEKTLEEAFDIWVKNQS